MGSASTYAMKMGGAEKNTSYNQQLIDKISSIVNKQYTYVTQLTSEILQFKKMSEQNKQFIEDDKNFGTLFYLLNSVKPKQLPVTCLSSLHPEFITLQISFMIAIGTKQAINFLSCKIKTEAAYREKAFDMFVCCASLLIQNKDLQEDNEYIQMLKQCIRVLTSSGVPIDKFISSNNGPIYNMLISALHNYAFDAAHFLFDCGATVNCSFQHISPLQWYLTFYEIETIGKDISAEKARQLKQMLECMHNRNQAERYAIELLQWMKYGQVAKS